MYGCPCCKEKIKFGALRCPHCGEGIEFCSDFNRKKWIRSITLSVVFSSIVVLVFIYSIQKIKHVGLYSVLPDTVKNILYYWYFLPISLFFIMVIVGLFAPRPYSK